MRIVAILFIILAIGANFFFNNLTSLVVAMFSFPVLLWVLLKRKKRIRHTTHISQPAEAEDRFE